MKRIISFVLAISLLISTFFISSYASESAHEYESVSYRYFDVLDGEVPCNCRGTCTHVAMSLLLSFYDIYWNDVFVDTKYECLNEAEGTIYRDYPIYIPRLKLENDDLSESEKNSNTAYFNFAQNNKDEYLHMYIVSLARELHFYDGIADGDSLGMDFLKAAQVFDIYFDDLFGDGNYYRADGTADNTIPVNVYIMMESSSGDNRDEILNKMKEELRQGNPVLYCGFTTDNNSVTKTPEGVSRTGHSMVAYYENDEGNILFHKGHIGVQVDTYDTTEYKNDIGILWIEINEELLPHECTEDFRYYENGEYVYVCSCVAYKHLHSEHIHEKKYIISDKDDTSHLIKCKWGCRYEEAHKYTYQLGTNAHHKLSCECSYSFSEPHSLSKIDYHKSICDDCGYTETTDHIFSHQQLENGHALVCECGYSYEEEHSLLHWNKYENHHVYVCECGYREQSEHNMVALDYHTSSCADCGYTRVTPHEPPYQQLSDTQHLVSCGCGYEGAENHIFTYTNVSASLHRMTCECGYTALEVHTFKATTDPRYQSCTRCGYTRDNFGPGGNVQMGIKKEEETE